MGYTIHKKPIKVSLTGLVGVVLYFIITVAFFRSSDDYYLILGGGLWMSTLLFMKSIGSYFFNTNTVTENSIDTVTSFGGIVKIEFADLDRERTNLSGVGPALVPRNGEPIVPTPLWSTTAN